MDDPRNLTWEALVREFYHPHWTRTLSRTDALREEIRRRVDLRRASP